MLEPVGPIMSTLAPEEAKSLPIEINGYAIVSDDDRIAGPDGLIPASLRNEKDWDCFQRALADSDLVVLGRRSHELAPNVRGDQRLVISRGAAGLEQHANVWWWNPARMSWVEVAKELLPRGGDVAVPGGQVVFDLFLKIGFDAFHLSRAHGVRLPGGERFFQVASWSLGRGRARQCRIARQRKDRARCRAWPGYERLARGPRDRHRAGRKSVNSESLLTRSPRGGDRYCALMRSRRVAHRLKAPVADRDRGPRGCVRCAIEVTLGAKPSNASILDGLRPLAPAAVCAILGVLAGLLGSNAMIGWRIAAMRKTTQ